MAKPKAGGISFEDLLNPDRAKPDEEEWKKFGASSQAGKLLKQLYGKKATIDYPKPKTKPREGPAPTFIPGGGSTEHDPRCSSRKKVSVDVPQPARRKVRRFAPVDLIAKRRSKQEIDRFERHRELCSDRAMPPITKPVSTDVEKLRLQNIFQFKGGRALPKELMPEPLDKPIPLSMGMTQKKKREMAAKLSPSVPTRVGPTEKEASLKAELLQLFEEVQGEVEERHEYLQDLRDHPDGLSAADQRRLEERTIEEIRSRARELEKINGMLEDLEGKAK